jgi:hypothetical protein
MDASLFGLIELLFVFGLVVAFGIWQLLSLRHEARRRNDARGNTDGTDPT